MASRVDTPDKPLACDTPGESDETTSLEDLMEPTISGTSSTLDPTNTGKSMETTTSEGSKELATGRNLEATSERSKEPAAPECQEQFSEELSASSTPGGSLSSSSDQRSRNTNSAAILASVKNSCDEVRQNVKKLNNYLEKYTSIISNRLRQISEKLEVHLASVDISTGEYQGILYDFADQVSDIGILVSQSSESTILSGELETKLSQILDDLNMLDTATDHQPIQTDTNHRVEEIGDGEDHDNPGDEEMYGAMRKRYTSETKPKLGKSETKPISDQQHASNHDTEQVAKELQNLIRERNTSQENLDSVLSQVQTLIRDQDNMKSIVKKYEKLQAMLSEELRCPVCLQIPQKSTLKMSICVNGHLTCLLCAQFMCPICRVEMNDEMYSPLAVKLLPFVNKHD